MPNQRNDDRNRPRHDLSSRDDDPSMRDSREGTLDEDDGRYMRDDWRSRGGTGGAWGRDDRDFGQAGRGIGEREPSSGRGQPRWSGDDDRAYMAGRRDGNQGHGNRGYGEPGSSTRYPGGIDQSYGDRYRGYQERSQGATYNTGEDRGPGGYDRMNEAYDRGMQGAGHGDRGMQGTGYGYRGDGYADRGWRRGVQSFRDLGYEYASRAERPSHRGKGPAGYVRSDARIQEDVNDALTEDHDVDAEHITVKVEHGDVTLTGTVTERGQKYRAEEVVERVSGVKEIDNQLRVVRDRGARDRQASMGPDEGKDTGHGTSGFGNGNGNDKSKRPHA